MTLKLYLWGLKISTLLSFVAWGLVVYYVNPQGGALNQFLFYLSLFLFLSAFFATVFTLARHSFWEEGESLAFLGMSFRQGILLAILAVALLLMQSSRVLIWWDGLLVVAGVFLIELYFLTR